LAANSLGVRSPWAVWGKFTELSAFEQAADRAAAEGYDIAAMIVTATATPTGDPRAQSADPSPNRYHPKTPSGERLHSS
jgi:hypothetical protein